MGQKSGVVERDVELRATDGVQLPAFVAEPSGAPGAPRIVIAPEIFGVSSWVKSVARKLAQEGFRAVAPEIFVRDKEPLGSDLQSWMARVGRLDIPQAVRDLRTALESLKGGRAASIGFCLGGALSLLTAAEGGLDACVDCYGRPRWMHKTSTENAIDAAKRIRCPVLAIYGTRDQGIPISVVEELRAVLPPGSEVAFYEAGHAFLNDQRPEMYVADQATLAWAKIIGFLRRNLT
jgi:carboxymethylenebutenolidase